MADQKEIKILPLDDHLSTLFSQWLEKLAVEKAYSPLTITSYCHDVSAFFSFMNQHLGETLTLTILIDLTVTDFRSWLSSLAAAQLKTISRARALSALRGFYKYLECEGHGINSRLSLLQSPKRERKLPRPIVKEAIDTVLSEMKNHLEPWIGRRDRALYLLLYATGLRISEALSLQVKDLIHKPQTLTILGKGKKERLIPLLPAIHEEMALYLKECPYPAEPDRSLFLGIKGKKLQPDVARKHLRLIRKMYNLPDETTPHSFRHSFASHLLQNGADMRSIQELMGHASLSSTQQYTEIDLEHLISSYQNAHPRSGKG